ncbi:MAG: RNA polymerase sigma factor [Defluviitaleaceae bacterium]|nr:RNA polymerase sigma factor [Defluviitaleaceae bacterium]
MVATNIKFFLSIVLEVINLDDFVIVEMFFRRQESAITESKLKYGNRLFKTSKNILHSNEDAEECVNDTLLKAWEVIPPNRPTMLGAFLAKIVRNLSINKWETKSASKRGGKEPNLLLSELEDCLPAKTKTEDQHESAQITQAINAFLNNTDKTARVAFVLRYFHGESIRAVSERFQMSESKVKSILFRTRKKLKTHLEKEGINI